MNKRSVLWVFTLVSANTVFARTLDAEGLSNDARRKATFVVASSRSSRITAFQRMKAFDELRALGNPAIELLKSEFDAELDKLGEPAVPPEGLEKFDERVGALRAKLKELRESADLTEQQLEKDGVAAMVELNDLFQFRDAKMKDEQKKQETKRGQLDRMVAFFKQLDEQQKGSGLPTADYLKQIEQMRTRSSSPEEELLAKVNEENSPLLQKLDRQEAEGIQYMNQLRVLVGLKPLIVDLKLCDAARGHSSDMRSNNFFDHESPVEGKKTFRDRAKLAGTDAHAENIYHGSTFSRKAVDGWFTSPGHHKNMFADWTYQAIGHSNDFWTQMFRR